MQTYFASESCGTCQRLHNHQELPPGSTNWACTGQGEEKVQKVQSSNPDLEDLEAFSDYPNDLKKTPVAITWNRYN